MQYNQQHVNQHGQLNKQYVLGMDVGGQSIKPHLFEVVNGELQNKPIPITNQDNEPLTFKTQKGKDALFNQLAEIAAIAQHQVDQSCVISPKEDYNNDRIVAIGVGMPGRFEHKTGIQGGIIKPGTADNLVGENQTCDQGMDGVNPLIELNKRLKSVPDRKLSNAVVVVNNDADAMLQGIAEDIRDNDLSGAGGKDQYGHWFRKDALRDKTALLGLGTGVGHAIISYRGDRPQFHTDGHASKLLITIDPEDAILIEKIKNTLAGQNFPFEHLAEKGLVRAEDLFKSPTFNAIESIADKQTAIEFTGKYMARTIAAIAQGNNIDIDPVSGWSEEDKKIAATTRNYIISGGLGSSADGAAIVNVASRQLQLLSHQAREANVLTVNNTPLAEQLDEIHLVQYNNAKLAEKATATMALSQFQQQAHLLRG